MAVESVVAAAAFVAAAFSGHEAVAVAVVVASRSGSDSVAVAADFAAGSFERTGCPVASVGTDFEVVVVAASAACESVVVVVVEARCTSFVAHSLLLPVH